MPPKNPVTRRRSLAIITGLVTCAGLPHAAASERNHQRSISIAVPDFSGESASDDASAHNITEIITFDLKTSGRLLLIESHGLVEESINAVPQFDQWRGINAECLVIGRIMRKPDQRVFVEFRLWDLASGQQLYGAQYLLQLDDWRRVPHAIAAAILERLVG